MDFSLMLSGYILLPLPLLQFATATTMQPFNNSSLDTWSEGRPWCEPWDDYMLMRGWLTNKRIILAHSVEENPDFVHGGMQIL
jgi:hypothetical protein